MFGIIGRKIKNEMFFLIYATVYSSHFLKINTTFLINATPLAMVSL